MLYTRVMIVGIDEVGRGPWAGPIVFGAVVLGDAQIDGLTDSKKLTKKRRDELDQQIRQQAAAWGLGWVHASELDELGLAEACTVACRRALEQIKLPYSQIILDGTVNFLKDTGKGPYVTTMKKADLLVPSVSAASIIAKVARDNWMAEQDELYPGYKFGSHVGYGTAAHLAALTSLGLTPLHRRSFAPIAKLAGLTQGGQSPKRASALPTKTVGDKAEGVAASYLVQLGYEILQQNWKTRWCEIDIVAKKGDRIYFVEVKYRKKADQGGGIAAITQSKKRQMKFAAELWMQGRGLVDAALSVIEVSGEEFEVTTFLPSVRI